MLNTELTQAITCLIITELNTTTTKNRKNRKQPHKKATKICSIKANEIAFSEIAFLKQTRPTHS